MKFDNNKNQLNIPMFGKEFSFPEENIAKCKICGYHPKSKCLLAFLIKKNFDHKNCNLITVQIINDIIDFSFNKDKRYPLILIENNTFKKYYSDDNEVIKYLESFER